MFRLVQVGFGKQAWRLGVALSLAALGVILVVVSAYAQGQMTFNFFALLMVVVLVLIDVAFLILRRFNP
jgi:hypothetical protein